MGARGGSIFMPMPYGPRRARSRNLEFAIGLIELFGERGRYGF
jgi:hypothetical protein